MKSGYFLKDVSRQLWKLPYMIKANNYMLLYTDTTGVSVREINKNMNRAKSERESNKRVKRTH